MEYGTQDYGELEKILGYHFQDKKHLDIAFTHKSFANECLTMKIPSYERYEFLGDAILQYVSSKEIFSMFPDMAEGELTKLRSSLVCEYTLAQVTRELNFGSYLYLSHGETITGGNERTSILADLFESMTGALYLDGGLEPAEAFIKRFLLQDIDHKSLFVDAKSRLQEYAQKHNLSLIYELVRETGPDHNKQYVVQVCLDGVRYETGSGHSKKAADQIAAHRTLIRLDNERK